MSRLVMLHVLIIGFFVTSALAQSAVDIKLVQQKLSDYDAGEADGKMGRKTREAILAYQRDWQIPETGEITSDLIAMLKREHPRTKPHWFKVSNQDCEVWNEAPRPREVATWTGDCVGGKTGDKGKLVRSYVEKGAQKRTTYDGERKDSKKHGRGVFTWANGNRYDGEVKDGKKHGRGVFTWADGNRYDGEYKDGKPHGRGTFISASGEREDRRWKNGCSTLNGQNRVIGTSLKACGF